MTLIACPECAKEISAETAACPHCSQSIATRQNAAANDPPAARPMPPDDDVPTQASGREWKIVRLVGGLLMVTGAVAWAGKSSDAGMVFFLGCVIYLGGRLGARWMQRI